MLKYWLMILIPLFYGCAQTSSNHPAHKAITEIISLQNIALFTLQNKKIALFDAPEEEMIHSFQIACRMQLNNKIYPLPKCTKSVTKISSDNLKQLRTREFPPTYTLPFLDGDRQIVCSEVIELPNKEILFLGGESINSSKAAIAGSFLKNTWIYNSRSKRIRSGPSMNWARRRPSFLLLCDRRILISGGWCPKSFNPVAYNEIFDPVASKFIPLPPLNVPRMDHALAELNDGSVIAAGGKTTENVVISSVEILKRSDKSFLILGDLLRARYDANVVPFGDKHAIIFGGFYEHNDSFDGYIESISEIEYW